MSAAVPVRVLFTCTGVGVINRGIESFFREAFDGLAGRGDIDAVLLKGAGDTRCGEIAIPCLPRTGRLAAAAGALIGRSAYVAEQLSSLPAVVIHLRRFKPDVVFYSDANLGFQLFRWRKQIGVPFRLLFSNGGPCRPPFNRTDAVHQVNPFHRDEALAAGEPSSRHPMVPYGIHVVDLLPPRPEERRQIRKRLGMPVDRPVVLSVGWISREHKRMDYLIDEIARLPEPRPFVQMLGAMDDSSRAIVELATRRLGPSGFSARSVAYTDVGEYYRSADLFALASLKEGFGRVYLEALMHGLPVVAHRNPVTSYVTGAHGTLRDLSREGELASAVAETLRTPLRPAEMRVRWSDVRARFDWNRLAPRYAEMFRAVAASPVVH